MKNILPCELNIALDCAKSLYELKTHKFNIERVGANMHYTSDIMGTTFVLVEDDFEHTKTAVDVNETVFEGLLSELLVENLLKHCRAFVEQYIISDVYSKKDFMALDEICIATLL
jgi:hypothetical protein|nr:MAG TPA_asm: hypothetical protein [Caudoviricetes sp.]